MNLQEIKSRIANLREIRRLDEKIEAEKGHLPGTKGKVLYSRYRELRGEHRRVLQYRFGYGFKNGGIQPPAGLMGAKIKTQTDADEFGIVWRSYCVGREGCKALEYWADQVCPLAEEYQQDPWDAFDEYALWWDRSMMPFIWHIAAWPDLASANIESLTAFAATGIKLTPRLRTELGRVYGNAWDGLLTELPGSIIQRNPEQMTFEEFQALPKAESSLAMEFYRSKKEELGLDTLAVDRGDPQLRDVSEEVTEREYFDELTTLARLSPAEQEAISMRFFHPSLTNADLASLLRCSPSQVGVLLYRARRKLQKACKQAPR